jgi:cobalt-zinc-cadmium efflux system protein
MVAEFAGGLISGSLALIADAGHMLTDAAGLVLAWLGLRLSRRPADRKRSYGYDRFGVLIAFANGLLLFLVAGWIIWEAADRILNPSPILGGVMLWVAIAGLAVNAGILWTLHGGEHDNLNMRAAVLHVVGDLLGSAGAIAAAVIILLTGWTLADPLLSVLVSVLILGSAWRIVRESAHILLEGTPSGLDARAIAEDLKMTVPSVVDVHHVHVWSLSQQRPMITLHARVESADAARSAVDAIKARLRQTFGIGHATVEIEIGSSGRGEDCSSSDSSCHPTRTS